MGRARGTRARYVGALVAALVLAPAGTRADDAAPGGAAVTGDAAWARVVGNTLSGTTPDGPFAEYVAADGRLTIADNDGKAVGRWRLRDGAVCTLIEGEDDEECRAVSVSGTGGSFTDAAGSRYPFEILPGNPKGL